MEATTPESFDVIVIGGGPSGSTVATLVAKQQHKVLLLDREQHPRYSIGESLLPSTIHGILPLLGVDEEVKNAGFTLKHGGTFRWGTSPEPWTFNFSKSPTLGDHTGYAYQVERSKFDLILLNNARKKGVDVRERHGVKDMLFENGRCVGVRFTDPDGNEREARAKWVVDASGNTTNFWRHCGQRVFSKFFQNVALFAYYENGKRLPPPRNGNILCATFNSGWFWYIPLSPTLTSVGAVIARERASLLQQEPEAAMNQFIEECPLIKEYLAGATRVTEGDYGKFRIRKDYSYQNSKYWVPGLVLVGDTACFVDPVISSGVHLATYAALCASRSINSVLSGLVDETAAFEEYEKRYRHEYGNFYTFLAGFYDMHKDENSYFWEARKVIGSPDGALNAFVQLVSGTNTGESIFKDPNKAASDGSDKNKVVPEAAGMMPALDRTEQVELMNLGQLGGSRGPEKPMFEGGLVPTADGIHWKRPEAA